jgi:3-carboxy-cis,cis-muconate cycloisomerase
MTAVASTMFDSVLYRDVFSTPAMRAVFSDEAQLKAYVQAEVALAVAQGETGVIPREAAQAIARQAPSIALDSEQLKRDTENVGYPIVGLVRQLSEQLGEAGRYVHWGATTQDIMDTATVLQLREAVTLIETQLAEVMATLADLARLHRDTPMAGRTHLQQALPITFGHKVAIWHSRCSARPIDSNRQNLARFRRSSVARWERWPHSANVDWMCAPASRAPSVSSNQTSPGTSPATGWSNWSRRLP